jgi:hypothetical protein
MTRSSAIRMAAVLRPTSPDMHRSLPRVAITGIGAVTPCGDGGVSLFNNLLEGRSGIGPTTSLDASAFSTRFAAQVRGFELDRFVRAPALRALDRFSELAPAAATLAFQDSGLELTDQEREDAVCYVGVAFGGIATLEHSEQRLLEKGPGAIRPFALPRWCPTWRHHRSRSRSACEARRNACPPLAHQAARPSAKQRWQWTWDAFLRPLPEGARRHAQAAPAPAVAARAVQGKSVSRSWTASAREWTMRRGRSGWY